MKHTVHEVILKNGAKGLVIDVPGATVASYQIHFFAGSRFVEDKNAYETAHIMEHMAFGANAKYKDAHAFGAEFEKNGAYHNAYTSDFSMVYLASCADFEWDRILNLQQVAITQPRFIKEELTSESGNVKNELTGYLNSHGRLLGPRLQQVIGEPVLDYEERLKLIGNVTQNHIKKHYEATHTAKNMHFAIAGKFSSARLAEVKNMLESWQLQQGKRLEVPKDTITSAKPFLIRRKEASNITFAWFSMLPRRLNDEEIDAMACVDHILTGTLHSKILGAARKRGLAYSTYSDVTAFQHNSIWEFSGQINTDTIEPLVDIIVEEVGKVLKGEIADSDIEAAKQYALGKHQMGAQTVGQINNWYAGRYFFDEVIEDFTKRPEQIKAINKELMVSVAREFIKERTWVLGGVGSCKIDLIRRLNDKIATLYK